jgi:hypothetical protein
MNCREFKSEHVAFVDDLLSAEGMAECHRHIERCRECAALDTRIRRSLLVVRNLPQIEPSADFMLRLNAALKRPHVEPAARTHTALASAVAAAAALAAGLYFALGAPSRPLTVEPVAGAQAVMSASVIPSADASVMPTAAMAAVPAGVPVWPAMFMVGELPAQMTSVELLEPSIGR